jgi:hypothetical protein
MAAAVEDDPDGAVCLAPLLRLVPSTLVGFEACFGSGSGSHAAEEAAWRAYAEQRGIEVSSDSDDAGSVAAGRGVRAAAGAGGARALGRRRGGLARVRGAAGDRVKLPGRRSRASELAALVARLERAEQEAARAAAAVETAAARTAPAKAVWEQHLIIGHDKGYLRT